jgi:glycosyltransferase involved in cell wall biosynthesis
MAELPPPGSVTISVVLASHRCEPALHETLDSIAVQQQAPAWECLIVANGSFQSDAALERRLQHDPRFRLLHSPLQGLTHALRLGCSQARGTLIARIDVGDAMTPERLRCQSRVFAHYPEVVLCTSAVEVCGPQWEPIWIEQGTEPRDQPLRADTLPPEQGIAVDIPHHASVMFRKQAYEQAGGYREQFYFGQDWDLWYRLALAGELVVDSRVLTRVRLMANGISSRHRREQVAIARLSLASYGARRRGGSDEDLLAQAALIRPRSSTPKQRRPAFSLPWDGHLAEGNYFIGEALRRKGDRRCHRYFLAALRNGFWKGRIWLRALQSLILLRTPTLGVKNGRS